MPYSKDPDAYPPECLEIFRRGYESPIRIELDTQAAATSLRHRLHAFRRALQASGSPFASIATSCVVRVEGSSLIIQPGTLELRQALSNAGVPFDPKAVTSPFTEEEEAAGEALDKLLQEQGFGGN